MAINFHAPNALRALKRLVKLQALVRGYLMRKRAAVRDQTAVKIQRARCSFNKEKRLEPEFRHQKSLKCSYYFSGRFGETSGEIHSKKKKPVSLERTMRRLGGEDHLWKKIYLNEVGNEFLDGHASFVKVNQMVIIEENEVVSFKIENVTDKAGEVFVYCKNLDTKIASFEILNFEAKGDLKEGIPEKT
ncbi:hypothetical protein WN944_004475 [Citrus x changshan-huyou]|uniref:Uncharacterized protein n=1 Tax=Citrus x changshan-huyou TaxID=2935761 RepID=A0AAP0M374_9ROSI